MKLRFLASHSTLSSPLLRFGLVRKDVVLLSIMIVNELTVFASLTVRFLRGVCQVLRSAQRLTVSRPGIASARQRTPPLYRVASGGSPPPLRVGCAVLHWMASSARGGPSSGRSEKFVYQDLQFMLRFEQELIELGLFENSSNTV